MEIKNIFQKALGGERIQKDEAVALFSTNDILTLGNVASKITRRKSRDNIVTYIIDRNINYTNICITDCTFCAFYRKLDHPEAYVLTFEELQKKIEKTIELGGHQILLQGGHNPELRLEYFETLFRNIKNRFQLKLHALSPPEIMHLSKISRLPVKIVLQRLKNAGLDSIPGGGAEILVDRVRQVISPKKCSTDEWLDVMGIAHRMELPTTATMMFGHLETFEERVEHLIRLRDQQDKTGGFTAFIAWTHQPGSNPLGTKLNGEKVSGMEYLKTLAISRIVLDNFDNLQSSWVTQGPKIGQMALFYGANDMGSVMIEENVVREAGAKFQMDEEEIRGLIVDGGFIPQRRNMRYELV